MLLWLFSVFVVSTECALPVRIRAPRPHRAKLQDVLNYNYATPGPGYQTTPAGSGSVACRPDSDTSQTGTCVAMDYLSICADMLMSTSADCTASGLTDSLCCYDNSASSMATTNPTSVTSSSTSPGQSTASSTTSIPVSLPTNSMLADQLIVQRCGVPNGDPSLFTSLETSNGKILKSNRRFKLKSVFKGSDKEHRSRFTIAQTIVGGFDAPNGSGSICWQVATLRTFGGFIAFCGGTIVGRRTIITAAHCLIDTTVADYNSTAQQIQVQTGAINENFATGPPYFPDLLPCAQTLDVALSIPHPNYNPDTMDNDVAVLILAQDIDFRAMGGCACPMCLTRQAPAVGDICLTSGYGDEVDLGNGPATTPRPIIPLKYVQQPILPPLYNICSSNVAPNGQVTDLDLFLCAGGVVGQDSCQGDSGGPLFCYNQTTKTQYLGGIVSSGAGCATGEGALYTKVSVYVDWVFSVAPLGDISIMLG